jgi:hypothetical protein
VEQTRWIRGESPAATGNRFDLVTDAVNEVFVPVRILH